MRPIYFLYRIGYQGETKNVNWDEVHPTTELRTDVQWMVLYWWLQQDLHYCE
jgi:hypothetical protein